MLSSHCCFVRFKQGGDVFALIGYIRLAGRKCSQARAVVGNCEAFFLESFDMAQNAR
ncbi:hypothetical protein D3C87_1789380 [compost metagenome]